MLLPYLEKGRVEAGCDEAGRGCLAGPVVAAAVILPEDWSNEKLNDSKKLTEKDREMLRPIIEADAIDFAVQFIDHQEIDKINILNASFLAMHGALDQLEHRPNHILIDGNRFHTYHEIGHSCIIKGDGKYASIAAASILAKTYRDEFMLNLHASFPAYGWDSNKGYPTIKHRKAILENGATPYHRMSFRLLPEVVQGKLF